MIVEFRSVELGTDSVRLRRAVGRWNIVYGTRTLEWLLSAQRQDRGVRNRTKEKWNVVRR